VNHAGFRVDQYSSKPLKFLSRASVVRPLEFTSMNDQISLVGPPGLDPGALGLKGTFNRLLCVGLVSWCCRNMRPKMRPVRTWQFAIFSESFKIELLRFACGFAPGLQHWILCRESPLGQGLLLRVGVT
jgi:hypothetical protein